MTADEHVEELSTSIILRCKELRELGDKWAQDEDGGKRGEGEKEDKGREEKAGGRRQGLVRAMKKKALVDLLRLLKQMGLSPHKAAVPEVRLGGLQHVHVEKLFWSCSSLYKWSSCQSF